MRKSIFLLLPLFIAAISTARDKPQNWIEVQSPHFLIITNSSEKQGRHVADQFERMRAVFQKAFPDLKVDPAAPIIAIALKDEKDFRALEPEEYLGKGKLQLAGLFLRAADKNYILLRLDAEGEHPYETVYHEYTHLLSSKTEAWLPLWLNEGLAQFYQTAEIRDKEALLGQPDTGNLILLRQNRLLPLPVLLAVDHNSPYYHEENKGSIFYAESWALTHYFEITDAQQHTHRLVDYADLVSKGTDSVTAATRAFSDLQKLQVELENYITHVAYMFKVPAVTQVDESAYKVQTMQAAQADAVRADFLAYNHRAADARSLLAEVLKDDPNNASAHETMGFLAFQDHQLPEARKWYGEAVKLNSQSYLANYYFAAIAMNAGPLSPEDETQVENSLHTSIKLNPDFAPSYDRLGTFYGVRHRNLDEALTAELTAIRLDPASLAFKVNCANIMMAMNRTKDAIQLLNSAASVAKNPGDRMRLQAALQNAERYQAWQEEAEHNRKVSQDPAAQPSSGVTSDAAPPRLARRTVVNTNSSDNSSPAVAPEEEVHGPHRFVTGTIKNVQCSGLSAMDFVVVAGAHEVGMHSPNYYKIQFSALGFTPAEDMQPCTQIEGRPAKVEFIEPADKSVKNRVVSVEMRK
jgi:tetratricopeptide (TPR) repeat protein